MCQQTVPGKLTGIEGAGIIPLMTEDDIHDLFSVVGPVTVRRMFGGKGIYRNGLIFALEVDGEILLKADSESAPAFREAGSRQWIYSGRPDRKPTAMPYWSIPEEALDDPDGVAAWAEMAYEAALRARK